MTEFFFDEQLLGQLNAAQQLLIGYSGGLDSTVLLHALSSCPQFKEKLLAVHINHGLSPNAQDWQSHCQQFCQGLSIPFVTHSIQLQSKANLEESAREARYAVFRSLIKENSALLLGHHQNDQAETLLLHLFRGAGVDGLSAMPFRASLGKGHLLRPLLNYTRRELEDYAASHGLKWVEDESNQQLDFSRNYVRHALIPLIEKQWPSVVNSIARSASHCQKARQNLEALAELDSHGRDLSQLVLDIKDIPQLSKNRIENLLRVWLKNNKVRMPSSLTFKRLIDEVIFSRQDALPLVSWGQIEIRRYQHTLYLLKQIEQPMTLKVLWSEFPKPLHIPGLGTVLARPADKGLLIPEGAKLTIKCREGGESLKWHGQTKQLKTLFQQWKIPPWLRERFPLLYINDELALVPGFAINDSFYAENRSGIWSIDF